MARVRPPYGLIRADGPAASPLSLDRATARGSLDARPCGGRQGVRRPCSCYAVLKTVGRAVVPATKLILPPLKALGGRKASAQNPQLALVRPRPVLASQTELRTSKPQPRPLEQIRGREGPKLKPNAAKAPAVQSTVKVGQAARNAATSLLSLAPLEPVVGPLRPRQILVPPRLEGLELRPVVSTIQKLKTQDRPVVPPVGVVGPYQEDAGVAWLVATEGRHLTPVGVAVA